MMAVVSGGKRITLANIECRTASSHCRGFTGNVRNASVTGAPPTRKGGAIMENSMCWTMWIQNSTVS